MNHNKNFATDFISTILFLLLGSSSRQLSCVHKQPHSSELDGQSLQSQVDKIYTQWIPVYKDYNIHEIRLIAILSEALNKIVEESNEQARVVISLSMMNSNVDVSGWIAASEWLCGI